MNSIAHIEPVCVFDDAAVRDILAKTGLHMVSGMTAEDLGARLEDLARQHYWHEFTPPGSNQGGELISFDAVADASVTPSRLRDRLMGIERSSKRVFSGTSRRPHTEKVEELLGRLGRRKNGKPVAHSGNELDGHSGSERNAVWLSLVRAVRAHQSYPQGYRANPNGRPRQSELLEDAIQALVRCLRSPIEGKRDAVSAARDIHRWVKWCLPLIEEQINPTKSRHVANPALNQTIRCLDDLYKTAFGRNPSLYRSRAKGAGPEPNAWERFLNAALERILSPEEVPPLSALGARWQRLTRIAGSETRLEAVEL